jgi:hypothetical protein
MEHVTSSQQVQAAKKKKHKWGKAWRGQQERGKFRDRGQEKADRLVTVLSPADQAPMVILSFEVPDGSGRL